jgi:hypothetical protein
MGILAKEKTADYKLLDEGTHLAICDAVVGVGLQDTPWGSQQQHVWLRFEVAAERTRFIRDGEEIDEPMTIWNRYNTTLSKKSMLRNDLEGWRGRKFTEEELQGFEMFNLVEKPCLLTVVHNHTLDRTYANISAIARVMKGQEIPLRELNAIYFSPDDTGQYDDVPEWLRDKFDNRVVLEDVVEKPAANDDFESDDVDDIDW